MEDTRTRTMFWLQMMGMVPLADLEAARYPADPLTHTRWMSGYSQKKKEITAHSGNNYLVLQCLLLITEYI